jgi:uronate dehydrogenase
MTSPRFNCIFVTGAAGRLGADVRPGLAPLCNNPRRADMAEIKDLQPNEAAQHFDLADMKATIRATKGVDAIVHFAAVPPERGCDAIPNSNIRGSFHFYEGARTQGMKRVVNAISVHATGHCHITDQIDATVPHWPDGLYELSQCSVEDLGRLYCDTCGIETVAVRMLSSFPAPTDRRIPWPWLSFDDCTRLVAASLTAPHVYSTPEQGIPDNVAKAVDNRLSTHLGGQPHDNTDAFRAGIEAKFPPVDLKAPAVMHLGSWFVDPGPPDNEATR